VTPSAETCNGLDDDCDGVVDECPVGKACTPDGCCFRARACPNECCTRSDQTCDLDGYCVLIDRG
jgi:hypothetical protein